jgi:hypothetical protein
MGLYRFAKLGLFPVHGGYYDQPYDFIEAVEVISAEESVIIAEINAVNGRKKS